MKNIKFTKNHEWLLIENDTVTLGITDFAQSQLGDIVFVELPDVGDTFEKGDEGAVIESVKAAGDIEIPITGEVIELNELLGDDPELVNRDPLGEGWFFKIRVTDNFDQSVLLSEEEYQALISE